MTGMPVFCMEANLKSGFKADERDYGVSAQILCDFSAEVRLTVWV